MKHLRFASGVLLAATAIVAASAHQAQAQSRRGPAMQSFAQIPSPAYNWTGFYLGLIGGAGFGNSSQTDPGLPPPPVFDIGAGSHTISGGLGGGGAGFNWQTGGWVFGLETDISAGRVSGQNNTCGATTATPHPCGSSIRSLGTVRGRLGPTFGPTNNVFVYATGGLAYGNVYAWDALTPASGSKTLTGWTAGGGVEIGFTPMVSGKLEYLYADLGRAVLFNIVPGVPETVSFKSSVIRAGVNIHFAAK